VLGAQGIEGAVEGALAVGAAGRFVVIRAGVTRAVADRIAEESALPFGAMTTSSTTVRHLEASPNLPIRLRFQAPPRGGCRHPGIRSTSSTDS
jgi:hypothetical protein